MHERQTERTIVLNNPNLKLIWSQIQNEANLVIFICIAKVIAEFTDQQTAAIGEIAIEEAP